MLTPQNDQSIAAHRIVRWMAIFGLFYGVFESINNFFIPLFTLINAVNGSRIFANISTWPKATNLIYCIYFVGSAAPILLVVGSFELLRWKRSGQKLIIIWAWIVVGYGLFLCGWSLYQQLLSSASPSIWFLWTYIASWISKSMVPA